MASGGPDLFVVCKHCGAEVSPYITECPYCGNRIQKRAPKIDRDGRIAQKTSRRSPAPSLPRLRRGEIPGIRHDTHPYATIVLVALGFVGTLLWRTGLIHVSQLVAHDPLSGGWWRIVISPFIYDNTGYAVITLGVIAMFGTLMERRHGPALVILLFLLGGAAGVALGVQTTHTSLLVASGSGIEILRDVATGGNGAALALLTAWAVPDLLILAAKDDFDGDLIGAGVLAAVIALMPLVAPEAAWVADGVGVAAGLLIGYPVARLRPT